MLHYTRKTQSEEDPYFRSMSRSRRLHRTKYHEFDFIECYDDDDYDFDEE